MPYFAAEILLSPGHEIVNIKVEHFNMGESFENIIVSPAARQFPLSHKFTTPYVVKPDEKIYRQKGIYPANMVDNEITQFMSGHAIGGFAICPVMYYPSKNKIELIESITIIVETRQTSKALLSLNNLRSDATVLKKVTKTVDNPGDIKSYRYPVKSKENSEVDILIVTSQELMPGFEDYVDYKMSTGFIVELKDVDDIYLEYEGRDNPEKIRNCIIDYYQNRNLTYVLLGGDADGGYYGNNIVPTRGLYCDAGGYADHFMPADIYYSCLDGTWDEDNDDIFGEPGEEDLFAEVFVGRMSVDNIEELQLFY
jgi:hypothetical protein